MKKLKQWFRNTFLKPSREEEAIMALADYLEDPMHDQYKVKEHIMDILGLEMLDN